MEIEELKIQVQLLETELELSRHRLDGCEEENRQLKATIRLSAKIELTAMDSSDIPSNIPAPPPMPPPMPLMTAQSTAFRSRSNSQTLSDAISSAQQSLQQTSDSKGSVKKATGRLAEGGKKLLCASTMHSAPHPTHSLTRFSCALK